MPSNDAGIYNNILETAGNTPMVRINRIGSEYPVEILAKIEMFNPGGSIKDRIAFRMIRKAEEAGKIKPGDTLVEPTSGNTGIGLALAGAVLGYNVVIVMPQKMSMEKEVTLRALGAQIVRTPTGEPHDSPNSNFEVATRIAERLPNAFILDQFANAENPKAHYETTAVEILEQTGGKLDYFVAGSGTGGTLTGCSRKLKEVLPDVKVIGADPVGSLMGGGDLNAPYWVEGIGYDFIPDTLDLKEIDEWVKVSDHDTFVMAQRLIREEGILVGGSCGTVMHAAIEIAKKCKGGERIVVVLPDSIRNYFSKFLCESWLTDLDIPCLPVANLVDWNPLV